MRIDLISSKRQRHADEHTEGEYVEQKMRREKGGNDDYKMVSVPGKMTGALEGMSAARLRQELEALRESEV